MNSQRSVHKAFHEAKQTFSQCLTSNCWLDNDKSF